MTRNRGWSRAGTAMALALLGAPQPGAAAAPGSAPPGTAPYTPPNSPLVLTRTLHRSLPGGAEVVTRRSYQVRILRDGDGFRVEGQLLAAEVAAPPSLHALAELERRRPDAGLFPIRLDRDGRILARFTVEPSGTADAAARLVADRIGEAGLSAADAGQARAFVELLRNRTSQSLWPEDVFHPAAGVREESRAVPMADGRVGRVSIAISAQGRAAGQVAGMERVITTELGDERRVTRERWELVKLESTASR